MQFLKQISWRAYLVIFLFILAYLLLGIIKHNHYLSGYDLAVSDQVMWKYSVFHNPLTTIHAYPFTYMFEDHIEFIYVFLSPIFWLWNTVIALISIQAIFFCLSGIPMYLLARKKGLHEILSLTLLFSYLFFFGTQNALWNDVHSNVFGVSFLAWMIYFLESGNTLWLWISFFFCITAKEDMAFLTGAVGAVWLLKSVKRKALSVKNLKPVISSMPLRGSKYSWGNARDLVERFLTFVRNDNIKTSLLLIFFSLFYLLLVFVVYFPHFTPGYRFSGNESLLANTLHWNYLVDTVSKRQIIVYSLGWFGFLPILSPLYLLPWFADIFHFFVLGHAVDSAAEIFLHYRVSMAPLLLWPTIEGIQFLLQRANRLPTTAAVRSPKALGTTLQLFLALYLLVCAFALQYTLHLPISYLTKSWFWHTPASVITINNTLKYLPKNASVVSQNNITPHIAHRDTIFTLWPTTNGFKTLADSPCGKLTCPWFHWVGNPQYMIVDSSSDFDIRHFLQNRPDFLDALNTFEKLKKISVVHREGTTTLYKVLQNP